MKLLSVNFGRSVWLVTTQFLNPRGRNIAPVVAELARRYQFTTAPEASAFLSSPLQLKFEGGTFLSAEGIPISVNVTVHDDGLVAETRASTEESDRFLDEALSWLATTCDLPHYSEIGVGKIYVSELAVQFKLNTEIFSKKFLRFVERMDQGISSNPGKPISLSGLHFAPDPETNKRVASFRIEKLAGKPFSSNEYFSTAPVPTSEHLELLEALEKAAAD